MLVVYMHIEQETGSRALSTTVQKINGAATAFARIKREREHTVFSVYCILSR